MVSVVKKSEGMMHDMTPKRFADAKEETTAHAHEVVAHLYKALVEIAPFTLMDGTRISVKSYQPPEINKEGEAQCGVDIILPDGHLEFTMRNTGWGKSFAKAVGKGRAGQGRRK
jgi:hypothetical protein